MPSPVGHALAGIAAGWAAAPRRDLTAAIALAAVAAAPDLDLLLGSHREWTHSVGAAMLIGLAAWLVTRNWRWGAAATLAWGSHVLLDWLGSDTRPPIGVMALWPFTRGYYESRLHLFPAISRRYWLAEFWIYNLKALAVEVGIVGPIAAIVIWCGRYRRTAVRR